MDLLGHQLTSEQQLVVTSPSRALRVIAFAGAGKTSTLRAYAQARPDKRITYLAFNKAMQREAEGKFPSNVKCITTHALAYREVGQRFRHKLDKGVRPHQAAKAMGLDPSDRESLYHSKRSLKALLHFLATSHLSFEAFAASMEAREEHQSEVLRGGRKLWEAMIDRDNLQMPMLHDGYLKLYQLGAPVIDTNIILFDEAQDANPVTLSIVKMQNVPKVFVGDPHQQIYGFRRAENAMEDTCLEDTCYLTESFRFGDHIARIANEVLMAKRETESIVGGRQHLPSETSAFLSRGNAALFLRAAKLANESLNFHIVGGVANANLELLMDIWRLHQDQRRAIKEEFVRNFDSFDSLETYATRMDERDLKAWCKVVLGYSDPLKLPKDVELVTRLSLKEPQTDAENISTAHKSKGLEWGQVTLAEDFPGATIIEEPPNDERTNQYPTDWSYGPTKYPELWDGTRFLGAVFFPVEEINIRYVVVTRAEGILLPPHPFSGLTEYIRRHPDFILIDSEKGEAVTSTKHKADKNKSEFAPTLLTDESPLVGYALGQINNQKISSAISQHEKVWPQMPWQKVITTFNDAAFGQKQQATTAGVALKKASYLVPNFAVLQNFLVSAGLLTKAIEPTEDNLHPVMSGGFSWISGNFDWKHIRDVSDSFLEDFPQWSWSWFAKEAYKGRSSGLSVSAVCGQIMEKAGIAKDSPLLRNFLSQCGVICAAPLTSPVATNRINNKQSGPAIQRTKCLCEPSYYKVGRGVFHSKFGHGIIENVSMSAGDYMLTVKFSNYESKNLMASVAKLERYE